MKTDNKSTRDLWTNITSLKESTQHTCLIQCRFNPHLAIIDKIPKHFVAIVDTCHSVHIICPSLALLWVIELHLKIHQQRVSGKNRALVKCVRVRACVCACVCLCVEGTSQLECRGLPCSWLLTSGFLADLHTLICFNPHSPSDQTGWFSLQYNLSTLSTVPLLRNTFKCLLSLPIFLLRKMPQCSPQA